MFADLKKTFTLAVTCCSKFAILETWLLNIPKIPEEKLGN